MACLLLPSLALLILAAPARGQVQEPFPDFGQRQLNEENVQRHRHIHEQYMARRRLLIESDDWKISSRQERKAKLNALKREFRQREQWMKQDYIQRREALWSGAE